MTKINILNDKSKNIQEIKNEYPIIFDKQVFASLWNKGKNNFRKPFIEGVIKKLGLERKSYVTIQKWFLYPERDLPKNHINHKSLIVFEELLNEAIQKQIAFIEKHEQKYAEEKNILKNFVKLYANGKPIPFPEM